MHTFLMILLFIFIGLGTLLAYSFLKIYVLKKFRPNKWIVFTVAIAVMFIPVITSIITKKSYFILQIVATVVFFILALWFFDLWQYRSKKEEKKIVIKPKAKPNRAKQFKNNK